MILPRAHILLTGFEPTTTVTTSVHIVYTMEIVHYKSKPETCDTSLRNKKMN